jgi:hypothetical protein
LKPGTIFGEDPRIPIFALLHPVLWPEVVQRTLIRRWVGSLSINTRKAKESGI